MNRDEILRDIKDSLGIVPKFFEDLPDANLEDEWRLVKRMRQGETVIPKKYRALIGLGVAAALQCRYSSLAKTEAARMFGATEEEIKDALLVAKHTAGWSTYMGGLQYDFDLFKRELEQMRRFTEEKQKKKEVVGDGRY